MYKQILDEIWDKRIVRIPFGFFSKHLLMQLWRFLFIFFKFRCMFSVQVQRCAIKSRFWFHSRWLLLSIFSLHELLVSGSRRCVQKNTQIRALIRRTFVIYCYSRGSHWSEICFESSAARYENPNHVMGEQLTQTSGMMNSNMCKLKPNHH